MNNATRTKQAVYFYPKKQCFKVDCSTKLQLEDPILLFVEKKRGAASKFFTFFEKEYQKITKNFTVQVSLTKEIVENIVKKHHLFSITVTF